MPIFMRAESYINRKTRQPEYSATGYYMSEKFDGQRAQWDPVHKQIISRYGNIVNCPTWFLKYFEDITEPVDGELFMGYGNWDLTGIFRAQKPDEELWRHVRFMLFDIADPVLGSFVTRRAQLEKLYVLHWSDKTHIELASIRIASSRQDIDEEFQRVIARGGEGIMLNSPHRSYSDGKTSAILKYKQVMEEECVIVGYKMGNGRLSGKLGAFLVHPIEDGQTFKAREFSLSGMNDHIREVYQRSHPIGTILHYRCAEFTKDGKPRHPVYLGICHKPVTKQQPSAPKKITLKLKPRRITTPNVDKN
jgi:DNA ligase-1